MSEVATILVIEDEPFARTLLAFTLRQGGYHCVQVSNGADGIVAALRREPSVVLLDLGLSDLDGRDVTRRIREDSNVPIIVVSARGQEQSRVDALDAGANDFVTKPFSASELLARVRVALRTTRTRDSAPDADVLTIGDLSVDFNERRVSVSGVDVHLTRTEYSLLSVLARSAGRVLTSRHILRQVWGAGSEDQIGYLRIYMKKLRYKIEREPGHPEYLVNQPGVGYILRLPR